jgi:hypothetical protein
LQFTNGLLEICSRTEVPDELDGCAHAVERRDAQDLRILQVEDALILVFVEQRVEHGASLLAVPREHVALADVVGPLAAGERRLVEGDMADQIERVEVLADLLGQRVEDRALVRELVDDRLLALRGLPALQEDIEAREPLLQRLSGEVAQGLGDQLAVLVEVLDPLGDDRGIDPVDVDLPRLSPPAGMVMSDGSPSTIVSSSAGSGGIGASSSWVGGASSGGVIGSP